MIIITITAIGTLYCLNTLSDGRLATLYLEKEWSLERVKHLVANELGIPKQRQELVLYGKIITANDDTSVTESGIKNEDVILVRSKREVTLGNDQYSIGQLLQTQLDPLNPESQKLIYQQIAQGIIDRNLEMAHENLPEAFGNNVNKITKVYRRCCHVVHFSKD
ncbi:bifunctional Ubiquitin-like domain superfamily/Ubiquitin-like domain [Babesia duncani]|uniref:Bifunctional Ubiquitin-like domain superfamily/Ubiquitin-like domain n=1 Tax=Babesia duncani TaxID=323732 RepID=A0AAD9PJ10_9APIC|nr:bifunctional Ubiquitin-like domain superfamily/Ubiquitin-like domain [Babesia duncani]